MSDYTPMTRQPLRELREAKGWRQSDLAERAGISRVYVSQIERGEAKNLSLRLARRLAALVDATTEGAFDDAYTLD